MVTEMTDVPPVEDPSAKELDPLRGIGRHAGWTALQLLAGALSHVAVAAVAVRRMGADEFGQAALVLAIAALVSVVDVGLGLSVVRTIASERGDDARSRAIVQDEVRTAEGVYVALAGVAALSTVGATAWAAVATDPYTDPATIGLVGSGFVVFAIGAPVMAVATGRRDFKGIAVSNSVGALINLAIVFVTSAELGAASVGLGYFAGTLIQRTLLAARLRRAVPWLSFRPSRLRWQMVRPLLGYSGPLVLTAIVTQFVSASDLVLLSILSSSTAVGLYRLGSVLPTWSAGALYRIYDVAFPALVQAKDERDEIAMLRILSRFASLAAGAGFGVMALERDAVVKMVAGDVGSLAADVLAIFAIAWACNVPAHGLILLLTARAQHHFVPLVVTAEALVNVVLSVILVLWWGPIGAVYATLVTLAFSNLVVLPAYARTRLPEAWSLVHRDGSLHVLGGAVLAVLAVGTTGLFAEGLVQAVMAGLLAMALVPVVGTMLTGQDQRNRLRGAFRSSVVR